MHGTKASQVSERLAIELVEIERRDTMPKQNDGPMVVVYALCEGGRRKYRTPYGELTTSKSGGECMTTRQAIDLCARLQKRAGNYPTWCYERLSDDTQES